MVYSMDWLTVDQVRGIAKGLEVLHTWRDGGIVHGDLKGVRAHVMKNHNECSCKLIGEYCNR